MRKILYFLLFLIVFIGCKNDEHKIISELNTKQDSAELLTEPDTIYSVELAHKLWMKQDTVNSIVIDTACINERKRAKSDIKAGKLIYYHSKGWYEWKEMAELLKKYNIEYRDYLHSCFAAPPGFEHKCYEREMWKAISEKVGDKKIDSLWNLAENEFVLKYPDSVYIKDGIDIRSKYLTE